MNELFNMLHEWFVIGSCGGYGLLIEFLKVSQKYLEFEILLRYFFLSSGAELAQVRADSRGITSGP